MHFIFLLVGVEDDAISTVDVSRPPHKRQELLVRHFPYLGDQRQLDINHSIKSVMYLFFLIGHFGPLVFKKLILLDVADFEFLAHFNGGPGVTLLFEDLGDVLANAFRDQLLRPRMLKVFNVDHIVATHDVLFVFSLTCRLNVFNTPKFHSFNIYLGKFNLNII